MTDTVLFQKRLELGGSELHAIICDDLLNQTISVDVRMSKTADDVTIPQTAASGHFEEWSTATMMKRW